MIDWELVMKPEPIPEGIDYPRQCKTPKCQVCGRFTRRLHLVWRGFPPEPEHAVGDCCLRPGDRTQP